MENLPKEIFQQIFLETQPVHGISKRLDSYLDDYYYRCLYHRYISKSQFPMSEYRARYHAAGVVYRLKYTEDGKIDRQIIATKINLPYKARVAKILGGSIIALDLDDNLWLDQNNSKIKCKKIITHVDRSYQGRIFYIIDYQNRLYEINYDGNTIIDRTFIDFAKDVIWDNSVYFGHFDYRHVTYIDMQSDIVCLHQEYGKTIHKGVGAVQLIKMEYFDLPHEAYINNRGEIVDLATGDLNYVPNFDEKITVSNCYLVNNKICLGDFDGDAVAPFPIKMVIYLYDDFLAVDKNDRLYILDQYHDDLSLGVIKTDYQVGYMDEDLFVTI